MEEQKQTLEFLKLDFQECFEQMRHYDRLVWQVAIGIFSLDAAILAVVFNLLKTKYFSLKILGLFIILGGCIIGLFALWFLLKNRIYYVKVARFINEVRKHYLERKPLGIKNMAGLYTNPEYPKYNNLFSSQLASVYIIIIMNSFYLLIGTIFLTKSLVVSTLVFTAFLIFQLAITICFLSLKENPLRRGK